MHHAVRVGESDRLAHPEDDPQHVAPPGPAREILESLAADQLHHIVDPAVPEGPDVVHRDDAGVLEARQDPRLALEPDGSLGVRHVSAQHLDRHIAPEGAVGGAVDGAHSTLPHRLVQHVPLAGRVRRPEDLLEVRHDVLRQRHGIRTPKRSSASARNSASLPDSVRRRSSTSRLSSRRAQARWLVTCVTGSPNSSPRAR